MEKFLSIVTPFYNRKHLIDRYFHNLKDFDQNDVEIILVDDGSTDGTYQGLKDKQNLKNAEVKIYKQENKGPGGARNLGLQHVQGKFVWLVDSDDAPKIEAYHYMKKVESQEFDYVKFDFIRYGDQVINLWNIEAGTYDTSEYKLDILQQFSAIYTMIFRRNFLEEIHFKYPEYCIYEDFYAYFVVPFYVNKFIKSDVVNYLYYDDQVSVTRYKEFNNRLFDRLLAAHYGFVGARKHCKNQDEVDIVFNLFEKVFLHTALYIFYESNIKGLQRIFMLRKIYNKEIKYFRKLYQPYHLKPKPLNVGTKTKILIALIDAIPYNPYDINDIKKINSHEWNASAIYPFS